MTGPFPGLSKYERRRAIWGLLAAELVQLGPLLSLERRMKRTGGPGIIPFELAGSTERSRQIMSTWGTEGQSAARMSLLLDYLFPATYAPLQALACTASADGFQKRGRRALASVGGPIAWGQLAAALFDYLENTALLLILAGRSGHLPRLARRAAVTKFALTYTGLGFILLGIGLAASDRLRR
jgi:hypothetical protein